jgi:hypothetical protein
MTKSLKEEIETFKNKFSSFTFELNIGHYVGEINDFISQKVYDEDKKLIAIYFRKRFEVQNLLPEKYNVMIYNNEIPLILDSIKKYFYLGKTNYIIANIDNVKYLIYKNFNQINIKEYCNLNNSKNIEYLVQKTFAFNWLMCIKNGMCLSYENNILVKSINPMVSKVSECSTSLILHTIGETGYISNINKDIISPTIINKWFDGKLEIFYETARRLIEGIDIDIFRANLFEIISFYNKEYVDWCNNVYHRFKFIKGVI